MKSIGSRPRRRGAGARRRMEPPGFAKAYWEKVWESVRLPQERDPRRYHELDALFRRHLPGGDRSFFEVGCAPGSWMAYFARNLGYRVAGVEYAERARAKTVANLRMLGVEGRVHGGDVFDFDGGPFDVVFSHGFIEHFAEPERVVAQLGSLCRGGHVVTIIPSLEGLNWWISRTFRPQVAAGHFPLTLRRLGAIHEAEGFETLHLGYHGCLRVRPPMERSRFAERHPRAGRWLDLPFRGWNKAVSLATRATGRYPHVRAVSGGAVYIGRKPA